MGFSPQQALVALAATDTGLDVQAALETLLAGGAGDALHHLSHHMIATTKLARPHDAHQISALIRTEIWNPRRSRSAAAPRT